MSNKLTKIEKEVCTEIWGGWLSDTDFVRNSKYFANNYLRITGIEYNPKDYIPQKRILGF